MKALFTLKSVLNQSVFNSLVSMLVLLPAVYPHAVAFASQTSKNKTALVFEITDPSVLSPKDSPDENQKTDPATVIPCTDPLAVRLNKYLVDHNSPLAPFACDMVKQPQWQRALAISWVESNFGRFCSGNNCSGIGGAPGQASWRTYPNKFEWFKDMCALMETPRYKTKFTTFEKMRGVYVQPGTDSWVFGAKTKYAELMAMTSAANDDVALNSSNLNDKLALQTFPQLAFAK